MTNALLKTTLDEDQANLLYNALEQEFEDDGLPLVQLLHDGPPKAIEIILYCQSDDIPALHIRFQGHLNAIAPENEVESEILPDIDWVAKSLEGLKPVRAGRFLVHGSHDRDKRRIGDMGIEIEAGQAFGTGHHGTTAGCLEMIEKVMRIRTPYNVLDLGTGSAVLAIAMAKYAQIPVLASDIDPVATKVARKNCVLNGVANLVTCITATGFHATQFKHRSPFDLIVANILAGPLMAMACDMSRHISTNGDLILSGILLQQRRRVIAAYTNHGFRHVRTFNRGEWVTMHFKR